MRVTEISRNIQNLFLGLRYVDRMVKRGKRYSTSGTGRENGIEDMIGNPNHAEMGEGIRPKTITRHIFHTVRSK